MGVVEEKLILLHTEKPPSNEVCWSCRKYLVELSVLTYLSCFWWNKCGQGDCYLFYDLSETTTWKSEILLVIVNMLYGCMCLCDTVSLKLLRGVWLLVALEMVGIVSGGPGPLVLPGDSTSKVLPVLPGGRPVLLPCVLVRFTFPDCYFHQEGTRLCHTSFNAPWIQSRAKPHWSAPHLFRRCM